MKDLNSVQLIGRLGQDPEVHYTDRGTARTTFSVATNRRWTDVDGRAQTETEWTRCVSWSRLAEIGAQYLHKGSRVYIQGRLHTSHREDVQTGGQRSSVEIVVDDLLVLDCPRPAARAGDEPDVGDTQPAQSTPPPDPRATAQQPIRRPPQPVELRTTSAAGTTSGTRQQPSRRRSHER